MSSTWLRFETFQFSKTEDRHRRTGCTPIGLADGVGADVSRLLCQNSLAYGSRYPRRIIPASGTQDHRQYIKKLEFPGGSVEIEGDRLAHELREEHPLTSSQLQKSIGEALDLARQDGATRTRVADRIEPLLRVLQKTKAEFLDTDPSLPPGHRVVALFNDLESLVDFLFYIPFEGGPPRIGDHDSLMPEAIRRRLHQLYDFAESVHEKKSLSLPMGQMMPVKHLCSG